MYPLCEKFGLSEFGCNAISPGLYVGYALIIIALVAAVVLPLINSLKNPSVLIKSGIAVAILLVIFAISYGLADSRVNSLAVSYGENESSVRLIGAGLIMFYIVFILAAIGLIFSEVNKALK
jgi:uncharacterized membrane protein